MARGNTTRVEANVFVLRNLEDLTSCYRLHRIRGLDIDHPQYYLNRQAIIRKLSFDLQNPVAIIERGKQAYLVLRDDAPNQLDPLYLVRSKVLFEPSSATLTLDFTQRSPENDVICLRFLNFMIQGALRDEPGLWQPSPGQPYFPREPENEDRDIAQYRGFTARAVVAPNGELGFCVDIKHKYVSRYPLPQFLSHNGFKRWKQHHCIYRYGHQWYQIQVESLSDLNVSEYEFPSADGWIPLFDFIVREAKKPLPPEIANLPTDTSVVVYRNNRGEERAAPTLLCYPTYGTDDESVSKLHEKSILPPYLRRKLIGKFIREYLSHLRFGDTRVEISRYPSRIPPRVFQVPDLKFGNGKVLSVRGTPNADYQISLEQLGETRLALLFDREAGFYERDPLAQQYLVLPQSVVDSYGEKFAKDLCRSVNKLYPHKMGYDPIVIPYDDRVPRTYVRQGKAILDAVNGQPRRPGFAVVMIHRTEDRQLREQDQLEALVVRSLRPSIKASVIHTDVPGECYQATWKGDEIHYQPHEDMRGKLFGYLRNVAIVKVLLNNQLWPFVLATPLHADLIIGVDSRNNLVGFVIVGKGGEHIYWTPETSALKGDLRKKEIKANLMNILRKELEDYSHPPKTIVMHWDGDIYRPQIEGAEEAIEELKLDGLLDGGATLSIVEISKSAPAPLRLFEVMARPQHGPRVNNPQVGRYYLQNSTDGYICATGYPFRRRGTVAPLNIKLAKQGSLSLQQCLEDVFYLTCLAWTRPEDCTRYPITIKLNDRLLGLEASDYDHEEFEVESILSERY